VVSVKKLLLQLMVMDAGMVEHPEIVSAPLQRLPVLKVCLVLEVRHYYSTTLVFSWLGSSRTTVKWAV
jgi:hypothetical protein